LHIVYLSPTGQLGGAETSLREMLAGLRVACPEWKLSLVLGHAGPLAGIARALGVEVILLPFPARLARLSESNRAISASLWNLFSVAFGLVGYRRRLKTVLESLRPDVVHSNGLKMHLLGAWACPSGASLIWHIHDYVGARKLTRHLLPRFQKACRLAIVNSNSVGSDLRTLAPALRMITIYNAIDLDRFCPAGPILDLDSLAGLAPAPAGTIRVGLVATFATWKGHRVFLQALERVSPDTPVRAYIIGGPIYQAETSQASLSELQEEVRRAGLSGKVGFTGFLTDTASAMRSLDVIVHASTQPEPFGMVIIEGMATGKAVIASQGGGARELFVDGENGLGHAPGDPVGLARQIERLCRDAALRKALGESGRRTAERSFPRQRMAAELLSAYGSVRGAEHGIANRTAIHSPAQAVGE